MNKAPGKSVVSFVGIISIAVAWCAFLIEPASFAREKREMTYSPETTALWQKLGFQGPLTAIDPRTGPASYLKIAPACRSKVTEVVKAVNTYGYAAARSEPAKAAKARSRIEKLQKEAGVCAKDVNTAYAVTALSTLSGFGWEYLPRDHTALVGSLPPSLYTGLLGAFLANQGKLEFGPLGELNGRPVLGAFYCEDSRIRLDPTLAPMDLASHFIHEMDHLMRDKYPEAGRKPLKEDETVGLARQLITSTLGAEEAEKFVQGWRTEYETQILAFQEIASLMMEESLASLQTSFRQVSLAEITFGHKKEPSYRIPGDLTLFSPNGPLRALWTEGGISPYDSVLGRFLNDSFGSSRETSTPERRLFDEYLHQFMAERLDRLPEQMRSIFLWGQSIRVIHPEMPKDVREIHRRVFDVYFPGIKFDERLVHLLNPEFWTPEADPLYSRNLELAKRREDRVHHAPDSGSFSLPGITIDYDRTRAMTELILEDLEGLLPLLSETSASCKSFLKAAREGRLAPYIGASPQGPEQPEGGGGIRPEGGGGIRPEGGGGIRPCVRLSETL